MRCKNGGNTRSASDGTCLHIRFLSHITFSLFFFFWPGNKSPQAYVKAVRNFPLFNDLVNEYILGPNLIAFQCGAPYTIQ